MTRTESARALAALAPALVATAILAAAGGASVERPATQQREALSGDLPPGIPLFDVHGASPSNGVWQRCVVLRNSGHRSGHVSMRLARPPVGGLASYVEMRVERGAQPWATPGVGCRGFTRAGRGAAFFSDTLQAFPTTPDDAVADGGRAVAPGGTRAYRISWSIRDSAAAQGAAVSAVGFVWEMTS